MNCAASLVVDMEADKKVAVAIAAAVEPTVMVGFAIGMGTVVVAGLVVHTVAVMGAIGVAVLVDCS